MLSNNPPLSIATDVLTDDTIEAVRRSPSFHAQAWRILDRWALNNPAQLRQRRQTAKSSCWKGCSFNRNWNIRRCVQRKG